MIDTESIKAGVKNEDRLEIIGGNRLTGKVKISGAKNAVLKLMAASLLANNNCLIRNVPRISDVETMIGVLKGLGAEASWQDESSLLINATNGLGYSAPDELVKEMRASVQVMGPLLARLGRVKLFQPGGCIIGQRPIDLHLKGFQALGAEVIEEHGYVYVQAKKLQGAEIHLDFPSVGATENIMAAAILAEGTTVIRNAAKEPEIIEEQNFYNRLGAKIRGAGTDTIRIEGVKRLNDREIDYMVIPDRIEAGTFMIAAAITGGDVLLEDVIPEHIEALTSKLREIGVSVSTDAETIRVKMDGKLKAADITVLPYPGFPTDLQPQITALMTVANGTSVITENVFGSRFRYVDELIRMGASIRVESRSAIVKGVNSLSGASVYAPDLRAGAALVIAGLAAEGLTELEGTTFLDRGYVDLEAKLSGLGAAIKRITYA
ncbi:MAG TPA: UDP-N-acetylglucosamine 1-carboxyvinyltransferase [Bacillota bacterium]|jgi:UDP-N-acetylglucosamine 1-carboxyvinyltransferase|nr:UDP-N-acetylglucosamine 1-carboxyvinyltransferase [Bacillota bacterium]HOL08538.1 UDP-N-acetylglucosamine 1-carboxyvinyltransferase [Bacillota bacterium]HPO96981.1 UDP-N-acetylglucosamine 1-carboxyvinyltransferase [Bacillota bacterium]